MPSIPRRFLEYAVAVLAVAVALLVRWAVDPIVGSRIPFPTVLGAVAIAVWFGGFGPALVATALGYVAGSLFFTEPRGILRIETAAEWITFAGYIFACFTVTLFGLLMRRANRREQAAARALAELNQRKDVLLATVAHELRNPLAPIRNAVEVLRMQDASGREVSFARDMIDRQIDHLTRIIDDLVAMDRIARNQLELRQNRVSLLTVVEGSVETSRSVIAARQHELVVDVSRQPLYVDADPVRVQQVVVNLLANAVKFTPAEGRIELALHQENGHAILRVKDSGIGITKEAMPRIFEMFYQADPTQRGLGIGLALVRQLVELHGGAVSVRSDGPGHGSEFVVRLPLASDQTALLKPEPAHGVVPLAEAPHTAPLA